MYFLLDLRPLASELVELVLRHLLVKIPSNTIVASMILISARFWGPILRLFLRLVERFLLLDMPLYVQLILHELVILSPIFYYEL